MPRNVRGCDQGEVCGYCGYGCKLGAKQSTVKTWLADAAGDGARIVVRTSVEKVLVEGGAARGVRARTADGYRLDVRAQLRQFGKTALPGGATYLNGPVADNSRFIGVGVGTVF